MSKSGFVFVIVLASLFTKVVFASPCSEESALMIRKQTAFAAPKYARQIELARHAAQEIYDHGFVGNSGSAINNERGRPPGMAVAVAVDSEIVWAQGFGFADIEQCVPATPETKFRIGSVSKPLTAAGVALLAEQKQIDLDAPIQRYVPSFPDKGYVITTRELLGHLGGIPRDVAAENKTEYQHPYHSVDESLTWFRDAALVAPPGSKFFYSTYGYVLASAAVEGASRQNFLSFMHDKVFQPLGMRGTVADENEKIIPDRARWYFETSAGDYRNAPYVDLSYKWAGAGFLSTVTDLARFGSALLNPGFLKTETLEMIFSSQRTRAGEKTNYGLGWEIHSADETHPERRFEHTGGVPGSSAILVIYPDQRVVVAWLLNSNDFRDWPVRNVAVPFFVFTRKAQ